MNNIHELFFELLNAQTEEDVKRIVENNPITAKADNWLPYGGSIGNYSSFENQMTTAEAALIEKLTNSIDAILTRQSWKKGIDPTSKEAPQSMDTALKTLFTKEEKDKENVLVVVDGKRTEPNIIIIDDGEGQEPDLFPRTFLSLQSGNKNNIKFVQGQFNMGSTGAVVFCGKYKYQLIASKRHSSLNPKNTKIGFTLVRKHVRTKEERETLKNTWYEYLTIEGDILQFESDSFSILPNNGLTFEQGTIVKMYNYQLTNKSAAYKHLRTNIDNLLYYPAFPIRVYEAREYKVTNTANYAYGNGNVLRGTAKETVKDALEYQSINNKIKHPLFGEVKIDIFLFKEHEKKKASDFAGKKPIVFLMNGQVQYGLTTSYITRELNFKLIKNHLVVSIDCTKVKREFLDEGFFQANRESIRDNEQTREFLSIITNYLSTNQALINLNKKRANVKISSQATKNMFERLLGRNQKDRFLKNLFKSSNFGSNTRYNDHVDKWEKDSLDKNWVQFPTYFKLSNVKENEDGEYVKAVEQGKSIKIKMATDVEPNYFRRTEDHGELEFMITKTNPNGFNNGDGEINEPSDGTHHEVTEQFGATHDLDNGELTIHFDPFESDVEVGDQVKIDIKISDNQGNEFTHIVKIDIKEPSKKDTRQPKRKRESISLPALIQVFKNEDEIDKQDRTQEEKEEFETWESMGWDEEVGKNKLVQIAPDADGGISTIYINMNSGVLKQLIQEEGTTGTKIAFAQEQFMTNLYTQSFLVANAVNHLEKNKKDDATFQIEDAEEYAEEIIKVIAYASVKMSMNTISSYSAE